MDYMDPDVRCPKKAIKINHSLTRSLVFQYYQNTGYMLNITFTFDGCHRSLAVETPVKCERDLETRTYNFVIQDI